MKNIFKNLRFVVAALVIGAAVVTLFGCAQPSLPQSTIVKSGSAEFANIINSYAELNGNIYLATNKAGDWFKVFVENGEMKIYHSGYPYPTVSTGTDKSYNDLITQDSNCTAGVVIAIDNADIPTYGGKMLLIKTSNHVNYDANYTPVVHNGCYIPVYISPVGNTISILEFYNEKSDFETEADGLANLPYSKGGTWSHSTTYTKQ